MKCTEEIEAIRQALLAGYPNPLMAFLGMMDWAEELSILVRNPQTL